MASLTGAEIAARIDPELVDGCRRTLTARLPAERLTVQVVRALDAAMVAERGPAPISAPAPVVVRLARAGGPPLELRVHGMPMADDAAGERGGVATAPVPAAILWLHGGGMMLGSAQNDDAHCASLSTDLGVPVAAAEYRLSPEHRHPEPLDDCAAALEWLAERADSVVLAGASAGAGLAAGLALRARDRSGPRIAGVHLYHPMLDDRGITASSTRLAEAPVWNRRLNELAWASYLGGQDADQYAAPARAAELAGFPPCYLEAAEYDLFVDEDLDFAARLSEAGVPVELAHVTGAVHAFDWVAPEARISLDAAARRRRSMIVLLGGGDRLADAADPLRDPRTVAATRAEALDPRTAAHDTNALLPDQGADTKGRPRP